MRFENIESECTHNSITTTAVLHTVEEVIVGSLVLAAMKNVHKTNKVDFGQTAGHLFCMFQEYKNCASTFFLSSDSSLNGIGMDYLLLMHAPVAH